MAAKLRLLQFCNKDNSQVRVGVEVEEGKVVDVTAVDPSIPADMKKFLEGFDANTTAAAKYGIYTCTVHGNGPAPTIKFLLPCLLICSDTPHQ